MSGAARPAVVPPSLRNSIRPISVAGQRTLPVVDALGTLLPTGLPRGVTLTTTGDAARSFAFTLTVAAGRAGSWLAVLGLEGPGWRAATELGVATERIVHIEVGGTASRAADCIAAALDGFDLVLVGPQVHLTATVERRLHARARERGTVLIGVHESFPDTHGRTTTGPFTTVADLRGTTRAEGWQGLGAGTGRLTGRQVEIVMEGKRLPGRRRSTRLWLPGPDGTVTSVAEAAVAPVPFAARSHDDSSQRRVERSA
ncbi:MAG TPA: hypothetical protein VFN21_09185 [Acidimicrobiales bacterium]|nr:hypothetical protein [Acidimicrobiales bacterium]